MQNYNLRLASIIVAGAFGLQW